MKLFELRKSEVLESRIKFKIQDLIDAYNKEWRFIFTQMKNRISDNEGFRQIYVPKDQILSEKQVFQNKQTQSKKDGTPGKSYIYREKQPTEVKNDQLLSLPAEEGKSSAEKKQRGTNKMANLLSDLKADDSEQYKKYLGHESDSEEDEEARNCINRRMSMNKFNDIGLDLHIYQETKPSAGVRREILNMFNEYKESENKEHARDELIAICD